MHLIFTICTYKKQFQFIFTFQLVSEGHTHDLQRSHRESRRKKTVSIWGISNTLNRMWKGAGRGHIHSNGRGPRRRQSIHVSHVSNVTV
jgi:hypothetical protein